MNNQLKFVELVSEGKHEEAKALLRSMLDEACKTKMYEEDETEEESEEDDTEEVGEKKSDESEEDK